MDNDCTVYPYWELNFWKVPFLDISYFFPHRCILLANDFSRFKVSLLVCNFPKPLALSIPGCFVKSIGPLGLKRLDNGADVADVAIRNPRTYTDATTLYPDETYIHTLCVIYSLSLSPFLCCWVLVVLRPLFLCIDQSSANGNKLGILS